MEKTENRDKWLEGKKENYTEVKERITKIEKILEKLTSNIEHLIKEVNTEKKKLKINTEYTDEVRIEIEKIKNEIKEIKLEAEKKDEAVKVELRDKKAEEEKKAEEKRLAFDIERGKNRYKEVEQETVFDFDKEKVIWVKKGLYWKEVAFKEWLRKRIGTVNYKLEEVQGKSGIRWLWIEREEKRKMLLDMKEEIGRENIYIIDEYLSHEERIVRFELLKKADEIEKMFRSMKRDIKIKRENKRIIIDGVRYVWNKEMRDLEEEKILMDNSLILAFKMLE